MCSMGTASAWKLCWASAAALLTSHFILLQMQNVQVFAVWALCPQCLTIHPSAGQRDSIAGDRHVNPYFSVKSRPLLKQAQITVSGGALLCSAGGVPSAAPYHEESCRGLTATVLQWPWSKVSCGWFSGSYVHKGREETETKNTEFICRLDWISLRWKPFFWYHRCHSVPALSILCRAYTTDTFHL